MIMNYQKIARALTKTFDGQNSLADELGVSQPTVSGWLNGADIKGPNLVALYRLARNHGFPNADIYQAFENAEKRRLRQAQNPESAVSLLTEEMCLELERKARNCRDNAKAERLIVDAFKPEYMLGISGEPTACLETNDRSLELYDFAIKGEHRERQFLKDAELFEAAAECGRAS